MTMMSTIPLYYIALSGLMVLGASQAPSMNRLLDEARREFRSIVAARYGRNYSRYHR